MIHFKKIRDMLEPIFYALNDTSLQASEINDFIRTLECENEKTEWARSLQSRIYGVGRLTALLKSDLDALCDRMDTMLASGLTTGLDFDRDELAQLIEEYGLADEAAIFRAYNRIDATHRKALLMTAVALENAFDEKNDIEPADNRDKVPYQTPLEERGYVIPPAGRL